LVHRKIHFYSPCRLRGAQNLESNLIINFSATKLRVI
jgi:hypothetical protein